ncbi:MAG: hypothetical protein GVY36_17050 [Verrucomicrobia bacterium]|jgi:hypothetical protein|nr:hypothetical protein [Verrucomicrobiota bacterium]
MSDLTKMRSIENLRRAWRWIRSNADASFKSYFRQHYQSYAIADDALLADLADRLKRNVYEPAPPCKLYAPKASGILRPYSLITVEDQIVYQAAVNIVADRLLPKVSHRYYKHVFGHLYAGKTSTWFYRKWSDGYKAFNDAARKADADGFEYTASFDLTACYDSIDHRVLRHFLEKNGHDPEFNKTLTSYLERWTPTEQGIFHNHGIPQGPQPSGLLSEVVLSHFDNLKLKQVDFRYFRYVDDIRLFARNEHDLRRLLVELDMMSKDIGLFPQSGKISIHRVKNIEKELKTISNPSETSVKRNFVDQKRLRKRIVKLTPGAKGYEIENPTRFKYLLAHADPNSELTARLWKILDRHPEIYRSACNYLRKYKRLPRVPSKRLIEKIKEETLYQSVRAEYIKVADGRLGDIEERTLAKLVKPLWLPQSLHPELLVSMGSFLIRTGNLTSNQVIYACRHIRSWWARATLIQGLNDENIPTIGIEKIISGGIDDESNEVARVCAWELYARQVKPSRKRSQWNREAAIMLRELGVIGKVSTFCGINNSFLKLCSKAPEIKWKKLFGTHHHQAERYAVEMVSAATAVNIAAFVNVLDTFNDLLLHCIYRKDGTLGGYNLGNIGGIMNSPAALASNYPAVMNLAQTIHSKRYESLYSHPVVRGSNKPTGRISYKFLKPAKVLLEKAIRELSASKNLT